jgi:hypothetical protein
VPHRAKPLYQNKSSGTCHGWGIVGGSARADRAFLTRCGHTVGVTDMPSAGATVPPADVDLGVLRCPQMPTDSDWRAHIMILVQARHHQPVMAGNLDNGYSNGSGRTLIPE